ncbi:MAG: type II secretion system minor pseudopilin GspI [Steroidobacteraceae bacterium]
MVTRRLAGFTLIEVLVALVIVAFGIGALLTTLTSSADNLSYLRDKSQAEWIALNRISELRLSRAQPKVGESSGDIEYAGSKWRWRQKVADQGMAGLFRIEVEIARLRTADSRGDAAEPALATAIGFFGQRVAYPSTPFDPDWSLSSLPAPGSAAPGGNTP